MRRRACLHRLGSVPLWTAAPWLAACAPSQPLRVGIHSWIGYETLNLALDFKWLPSDVQLDRVKDLNASAQGLQDGLFAAACLTLDDVLRLRASGTPVSVALVFDVSAGADVVLAQPSITKLADLAGKRIGMEPGALGALVLGRLLEAAQLPATAITLIDMSPEQQVAGWRNGHVDAVIGYEPTATMLQRAGAKRLFDSRQMPDTILDVLAVRNDRMGGHSDAMKALVAAHFRGLAHLQVNRQDAVYRIASRQGMTPKEVQQALGGVVLPSLEANRQYLAQPHGRLVVAARNVSTLMVNGGLLKAQDTLVDIGTAAWLPRDEG